MALTQWKKDLTLPKEDWWVTKKGKYNPNAFGTQPLKVLMVSRKPKGSGDYYYVVSVKPFLKTRKELGKFDSKAKALVLAKSYRTKY